MANPPNNLVVRFGRRLRFPYLFLLTAVLFVVDLFVPDFIPLADEILLGLGTLVLGSLRRRVKGSEEEAAGAEE